MVIGAGSSKIAGSGQWNGHEFNGLHVLGNSVYKAIFVNKDEVSALYESKSDDAITRVTLNHSGFLQHLVLRKGSFEWDELYSLPHDICRIVSVCPP